MQKPQNIDEPLEKDIRVERALEQFESHLKDEKQKKKVRLLDQRWTKREGVYMILYEFMLLAMFGGVQGFFQQELDRPAVSGFQGIAQDIERNLIDIRQGFVDHFSQFWHIQLLFVVAVVLVAFAVKDIKRRRRYFNWLVVVTVLTMTFLILVPLNEYISTTLNA